LRIWNRRAIIELVGKELSRAKRSHTPLSVLLADLDLFKRVNDSYGHFIGDDVLRDAAREISSALRNCDHVGRYEGEQFLVILPSCTAEAAREVAERVRQQISEEPLVNEIKITISIGVSQWVSGQGISELLYQADIALSRAKQNGRNRVEVENVTGVDAL